MNDGKEISSEQRKLLYERLAVFHPEIVIKGATIPYTSINGNMYSYLSKNGFLALRLPKSIREDFLKKYQTTLVTAFGVVQKEYVVIPDSLLQKTEELNEYLLISFEYASGLKPKATKKTKK